MADEWIRGFKFFYNGTAPFDRLEPYSTIAFVPIGIVTFAVSGFVYITLLRNRNFRGKAYFQIFIAQGFIDLLAFLTNLLRYRLALFEPFGRFYASLSDSFWASTICVLALSMPRAQLVAQCLLSANRLLAVMKPFQYDKWQSTFSKCALLVLTVVPLLVAIPDILVGYFFGAVYGVHGTVIFFSSAQRTWPDMRKLADILATSFQFGFTIFAVLCNCVLIAVVATKKGAMKVAGKGLLVTTLAQFVTHLAYAVIMVFYLYFPPPLSNASMFTTIALDAISILPIWMLLAFSSAVREAVMKMVPGWKGRPVSAMGDRLTMTVATI